MKPKKRGRTSGIFKKGNVGVDSLYGLIILFALAIVIPLGYMISDMLNTDIQADSQMPDRAKNIMQLQVHDKYPSLFDGIFVTLMVGLWAGALVASFWVDSHPIFLVFAIILLIIVLILAAIFYNSWEEVIEDDPEFSTYNASFPMMSFVMNHLLGFVLAMGATIMIVLYGKFR